MEFARHRIGRGIPQGMGELGGWFFLILQHQLGSHFSGLGVNLSPLDLLFRNFGLRLICFGGGLVRLADGLFQCRISPFFLGEAQARLLIQTIPPA